MNEISYESLKRFIGVDQTETFVSWVCKLLVKPAQFSPDDVNIVSVPLLRSSNSFSQVSAKK
jgi:hypothetical protein